MLVVLFIVLIGAGCAISSVVGHRIGHEQGFSDGMKYESEVPKCKYCHSHLPYTVSDVYVTRSNKQWGVFDEECLYDSVDCPVCGCQNVIGTRYRRA